MNKQKGPSQDMVPLDNGILVPRALHDELFEHVRSRIPVLKYGKPYKAKDMVEPHYYASKDPWFVGRCVSHWERHNELQLRFLGCPYCSVRNYERT
jgi:hypothetical protein